MEFGVGVVNGDCPAGGVGMSWWEHEIPGLRWWSTLLASLVLGLLAVFFAVWGCVEFAIWMVAQ